MSTASNVEADPAVSESDGARESESASRPVRTEAATSSSDDYEIGYGKPPKSGQFQPGKSGNPRGRRKSDKTLKATLKTIMGERITVHTGKGPKRLTKMEAFVQRVTNAALSGDVSATRHLVGMIQMAGLQSDLGEALDTNQVARMMAEDQAILDRHLGLSASPILAQQEPSLGHVTDQADMAADPSAETVVDPMADKGV